MRLKVTIDDTAKPLVVCTYADVPGVPEFDEIDRRFREIFAQREKILTIHDLQRLGIADASARKRSAEVAKGLEGPTARYCVASVMVVKSPIVRGAMTAIRWIASSPCPEHYVATLAKAAPIVLRACEDARVHLSLRARSTLSAWGGAKAEAG